MVDRHATTAVGSDTVRVTEGIHVQSKQIEKGLYSNLFTHVQKPQTI